MKRLPRLWILAWACLVVWLRGPAASGAIDYAREIKPILKARCLACHGALKQKSALRLDTGLAILAGGDSGAAVDPGHPEDSLLIERITAEDPSERMPPEGEPLKPEEIQILRAWIAEGARSPVAERPEEDPRAHWAFRPPARPEVPETRDGAGVENPIDAFIASEHEKLGRSAQGPASRSAQLRRVTLDLIGLPPTPEELRSFLADESPGAYDRAVDRLLQSPLHGERWGRHWMDVWRYSDWFGRRHVPDVWNSAPQIWRWRDWIVASLNADHGYDRMVREMLAADEICPKDDQAGHATGFLIRNWYALNPNDWMRSNVEHTGKAFLGLTFNCAHCHDHKYDPIAQDDYFHLRAFFEPIAIRQDRVPGEADPGPFQEYDYSVLRKIQRLGAVRIFDKSPDAPTWFYTGGDERNRLKERGPIAPGVPAFLAGFYKQPTPLELPPVAWNPGLRPELRKSLLAEARAAVVAAETAADGVAATEPSEEVLDRLSQAETNFAAAVLKAEQAGQPGALKGRQSLVLDASASGRRLVQNRLDGLKALPGGTVFTFQVLLQTDAHFNFQLAKDVQKGLTAGYVGWDKGRIVSYAPGSTTEFVAGSYKFAEGQNQFEVKLVFQPQQDRALLTVRSLKDQAMLVGNVAVAINGWNPVGDATKAIAFDAHAGSVAVIDEVRISAPAATDVAEPVHVFDFEAPKYPEGLDVIGLDGWIGSSFSAAPAKSFVSLVAANPALQEASRKREAARQTARSPRLPRLAAEAKLAAARATLASVEARIAADDARFLGAAIGREVTEIVQAASLADRRAGVSEAEANVLALERDLSAAEAKPATDASRGKAIEAAKAALAKARLSLDSARVALADSKHENDYTPFSPIYPKTSTGRRRALAEWITDRGNPLAARVAVNHVWMRHFHAPLVASVYDFGRNGARPTHPALLDWLAVEFMESGWSMKHLHRLIVTSAAYRRSSSSRDASEWTETDPENKMLWRMNVGRMEAEALRDSLLACGGKLDLTMGGQELENSDSLSTRRRSLYYSVHPEQGGKSPLGELFDGPEPLECYRRTRSVVPQQALALTNSDLVHQLSASIVARWEQESGHSPSAHPEFVSAMFERILSRSPTGAERGVCLQALSRKAGDASKAKESVVRALLNHNDFISIR